LWRQKTPLVGEELERNVRQHQHAAALDRPDRDLLRVGSERGLPTRDIERDDRGHRGAIEVISVTG
jgi:hypothetical protein